MREQERPQHAITDAVTNSTVYLPYTDDEWQGLKAKQARVQAEQEAEAAAEIVAKAEADSDKNVLASRPTNDDIKSTKTISELRDLMLRQNAALNVVLKRLKYISTGKE